MRRLRALPAAVAVAVVVAVVSIATLAAVLARRRGGDVFANAPVVLISIDTLRSDHLPAYGYAEVETPEIDALKKDSILYTRAFSNVPMTLPSHATILTGLLPERHGVRDNIGYTLRKDVPTLAGTLKAAGYATGGAVSAVVLAGGSGISRGFDFWEDAIEPTEPNQTIGRVQRAGSDTAALLTRWIDARAGEPFFAFLHLYEPHTPYTPPEPFASRYREHPYDGEIAAADATLGSFLAHLKETGVYDRAIVVLLSDHGEGLGEHGEDEHGVFLYRASLQVPLLLKLPKARRGGTVVNEPAQLADVTPTLEALTGAAHAAEGAPTLLTLAAAGERSIFSETLYPRLHLGWSDLRSFIAGNAHYIEAPRAEFYDVAADPSELHDLAPQKPDRFRRLRVAMETRPVSFAAPDASDKEEVARLAALGYVTAAPPAAGALPDPKDRIETVRALKASFGDFTLGRYEAAAEGFRKLLAENPRMTDVWEAYSDTLVRMGRAEDALLALKKGVESSPNAPTSLLLPIAELDLRLGRLDEARRNAEAARAAGNPGADDVLSRVFLAQKDWTKAEAAATAALAARGSVRAPYLTLARVAMARGDLAGALARLDELERRTKEHRLGPMSSAHFLRGDVLARLERPREAEAEFLAEIRLFPHNVEARSSLAMLYASEGRLPDLRRAIDDLVRANPVAASYDTAVRILGIVGDRDGVRAVEAARRRAVNGCSRFQTPTVAAASSSATLGIPLLVNVAAGKPDGGGHIER